MKELLRRLIPNSILQTYYRYKKWHTVKHLYMYNAKRFSKYCTRKDSEESLIGYLTMAAHGIEKGFTMPDFRPGFGHDRIIELLDRCEQYISIHDTDNIQIHHIAKVVFEYKLCHERIGYNLDKVVNTKIEHFLSHFKSNLSDTIQKDYTREEYFAHKNDDFSSFSNSRHSCRSFSTEPISIESIDCAVKLAQNAPSACNRQAARVYVIENKDKIKQVLLLHGGNRGFGQTIDKLIVICGYVGCYGVNERDCVYVDCGIFTMNLAYALHYYSIGNCILNWSVTNDKDISCRKIIPIKYEDVICTLIACGNTPKQFKVCTSGKKNLTNIIHYI